jgi:hypothetical protein
MDNLKVWIESGSASMSEDGKMPTFRNESKVSRPPPLLTSSTYDDEEAFVSVSLNLLSRYEALGLSAKETIKSTLIYPRERDSFFEALCARKSRSTHISTSTASLVDSVDRAFGRELMKMTQEENGGCNLQQPCVMRKFSDDILPTTPRATNVRSPTFSNSESRRQDTSSAKKNRRRFFPESGFFGSRKVQNIDWKLAEAIEQVQCLRLDGSARTPRNSMGYEPPSPPIAGFAL